MPLTRKGAKRADASIILNLHRESLFLKRTLLSIDNALRVAIAAGFTVELVAILDRTDGDTRTVLAEHDIGLYADVHMLEVDNGSLGLSRNDGISKSSGEIILTADGDDLISENFVLDTVTFAQSQGPDALYFAEYLLAFGASYHI